MPLTDTNISLYNRVLEIYESAGLPYLEYGTATGGSDAAYTTIAGIPTLDNLGTEGGAIHSVREYIRLDSLKESAKRIAAVVYKI